MAMVDLAGVHKVRAKGRDYYYAWRGGPRLQGDPGSAAFVRSLQDAQDSLKRGDATKVAGLCADWRRSDLWAKPREQGGLADSTRKNWSPWLDRIQVHFGALSIRTFDKPEIRQDIKRWRNKFRDTPRAADMGKQVLSALLTFAVDEGRLASNPCFGIANLYHADRADIIWTAEDLAHFAKTASDQVMTALKLACLTGLRQSDLLRLSWSHIGELSIELPTGKSGGRRTAIVPLYEELTAFLATIPKRSTAVLTNADGDAWRSGFSSSWNKAMKAAWPDADPFPLHFHDARGTFATKAYEADFKIREIAEMLAWSEDQVERIIDRYVLKNAKLRDKIRRLDEARRNTP